MISSLPEITAIRASSEVSSEVFLILDALLMKYIMLRITSTVTKRKTKIIIFHYLQFFLKVMLNGQLVFVCLYQCLLITNQLI